MSLVDYSSSSDDDVPEDREEREDEKPPNETQGPCSSPTKTIPQISESRSSRQLESAPKPSASSMKLPDASLLLNSPTVSLLGGTDHASRVSVAMAESASRKRDSNELPSALPRTKVPKGTLRQTKSVPDTVGGLLIPPQLTGRSNIVTEDIGRLFVRKNAEPSSL